jgi:hypothetical protein
MDWRFKLDLDKLGSSANGAENIDQKLESLQWIGAHESHIPLILTNS